MNWSIKNMQDKKGYFYYQLKKRYKFKNFVHALEQCIYVLCHVILFVKPNQKYK